MAKVTVDGEVFDYDATRLLNTEAIALQKVTGMNTQAWMKALTEGDAYALTGLVWLLYRRNGRDVSFDDVEFDIGSLELADDAPAPEPVAEGPTEVVAAASESAA